MTCAPVGVAAVAPRPRRAQLRLVLAVSLDGRLAPAEGGAAQLGGRGDRRVLEEALAWADATLVGAETLRRHRSHCLIHHADLLNRRRVERRSAQPIAIVVSRSAHLPADLPFFRQPLQRWWLGPAAARPDPTVPLPAGFARHLPLEGWPVLGAVLPAHGIERLAVLGGARLAAALLAKDCIDELQLTLCPRLLGGSHCWVPAGEVPGLPESGWDLHEQRSLGDGEMLLRYRRARPQPRRPALTDLPGEDCGDRSGGPVPATARL